MGGQLGRKAWDGHGGAAVAPPPLGPGERVSDTVRRLPAHVCCQAPVSKTHLTGLSEAFIRLSAQLTTERVIAAPPPEALRENKVRFCPAPACRLAEGKLLPVRGRPGSAASSVAPAQASSARPSPARPSPAHGPCCPLPPARGSMPPRTYRASVLLHPPAPMC